MREHPTPETLARFLRGELPQAERRGVVRHLVRGCGFCRAAAEPVAEMLFLEGQPKELEANGEAYVDGLDRAIGAALRAAPRFDREARRADEAYAALVAEGPASERFLDRRFQGLPNCWALMRRSWELRHQDPAQMLELAHLAVYASERLDAERLGAAYVADLQVQALGECGNAQRINGDLRGAERTLEMALDLLEQGSEDPLLGARLLSLQASLFGDQRRFRKALELLQEVEATYAALEDSPQVGRAVIKRGIYTGYSGDVEEAISLLRRGLELIDEDADPQLALAAVHNLAWLLSDSGKLGAARSLVVWKRGQYERYGDRIILLKRTWLEGHICAGLGKLDDAAKLLAEAMHGFNAAGLGYQTALAALELAGVWIQLRNWQAAIRLVEEAAETFEAVGVVRESLVALSMLKDACEKQHANAALCAQEVATFFRRLEHDPTARFQH